jgi:hypothetical protein
MEKINRPGLRASLPVDEFRAWYWLKEELVGFCRFQRLPTSGSKRELEARIHAFLSGASVARLAAAKRRAGRMPRTFTMETVIGEGWRCGPALGAFFRQVVGKGFHFNADTRAFIHNGAGKTLGDVALCYQNSVRPGRAKSEIPEQLEYNRHFREYFEQHPEATREDAITAWWAKRTTRKRPV